MAAPGPTPVADVSTVVALFGVGTLVFLVLGIGIVWFVTRYQQRLLEQQARAREMEAALQRRLLETVWQTQEEERRRIARDLHDDVGTTLSALKMAVYGLSRLAGPEDDLTPLLDDVIQRVRTISSQLMPATLEKLGLTYALPALVKQLQALTPNLRLDFELITEMTNRTERLLPPADELTLYRITQELLGNAIKHAAATQVWVRLRHAPPHLDLEVEDNGQGFDYAAARRRPATDQPGGLGLLSMESRVGALHGALQVDSAPGQGTRTRVRVPVP